MPWSIRTQGDPPIIETTYAGLLSPTELTDAIAATIELVRTSGVQRLIGDCSELEGGHSIADLYLMADLVSVASVGMTFREAVILPGLDEPADSVAFWETACYNRGLTVRVFKDRGSALAWLLDH